VEPVVLTRLHVLVPVLRLIKGRKHWTPTAMCFVPIPTMSKVPDALNVHTANRSNAAWPFRDESSSAHAVPTAVVLGGELSWQIVRSLQELQSGTSCNYVINGHSITDVRHPQVMLVAE
jgi:hypothetical protein